MSWSAVAGEFCLAHRAGARGAGSSTRKTESASTALLSRLDTRVAGGNWMNGSGRRRPCGLTGEGMEASWR